MFVWSLLFHALAQSRHVLGGRGLTPAGWRGVQALQLANTLIVPPESLLEVVDTGLQMDRGTARKYVALREDYVSARVDGKSLATLLGEPAMRLKGH